jgi:hypothetical protein
VHLIILLIPGFILSLYEMASYSNQGCTLP